MWRGFGSGGCSGIEGLIQGYLEKGNQAPMAQGRSTEIISVTQSISIEVIKWIRISRLSIKNSLTMVGSALRHQELRLRLHAKYES
jgi:hypothetical protein